MNVAVASNFASRQSEPPVVVRTTLYSLEEDGGAYRVYAYDEWGKPLRTHPLHAVVFSTPERAYAAIRTLDDCDGAWPSVAVTVK